MVTVTRDENADEVESFRRCSRYQQTHICFTMFLPSSLVKHDAQIASATMRDEIFLRILITMMTMELGTCLFPDI